MTSAALALRAPCPRPACCILEAHGCIAAASAADAGDEAALGLGLSYADGDGAPEPMPVKFEMPSLSRVVAQGPQPPALAWSRAKSICCFHVEGSRASRPVAAV